MKRKRTKKVLPKIGRKHVKSQFEFDVYKTLAGCIPRGYNVEYEADKLPYVIEKTYSPDFTITRKDGSIMFIETKGLGRAFDYTVRAKMIAVKKMHPETDIRILFFRDGLLGRGTKMTASAWAEKYGFPYAIAEIPKDWFDG